jgi:2Fe-2S ferredoxin
MKDAIIEIPCPSLHLHQREIPILQQILDMKIPISHSCGGNGTCGTCRVIILGGSENLSPREELETEFAESRNFSDSERLACQTFFKGPVKLKICQFQ